MGRRDPSRFNQFIPREHAEPVTHGTLTCSMCGATAVQHLALGDGWTASMLPTGGVGYLCTKKVCRDAAREKGMAV